jgi:hypothetical protein
MQQMLRSTYWRISLGGALLVALMVVSLVVVSRNLERVDFKVYPTSESPQDFYGRVFAKTRTEAINQTRVTTQKQASQLAGFQVLVPALLPEGMQPITGIDIFWGAHTYRVDVNFATAHTLLAAAGLATDSIPEGQDRVQVTAAIEPSVVVHRSQGARWFTLFQGRNPAVTVSDEVDLVQLRELGELGLQFLGLSSAEARQLSQRMNWAAFLVLPPADMNSAEPVSINGHSGYVLHSTEPGKDHTAVLWEAEGVLYGLYGGLSATELVAIAESLK